MLTNFLGYVSTKALRGALVVALGATLAALTAVALVAVSPAARAADGNCQTSGSEVVCTFDTPGTSIWTVPASVQQATFDVFGAQGGPGFGGSGTGGGGGGGLGGEMKATFSVEPTTQFEVNVGGVGMSTGFPHSAGGINGGGNGGVFGGGGGGGASDVRVGNFALADRIMVAGGGGGGGGGGDQPFCPNGNSGGAGGFGSGDFGEDGDSSINGGGGGGGGTAVGGGFGGSSETAAGGGFGGSGTLGFGGPGGSASDPTNPCIEGGSGGGGGGGYYGGGGGGSGNSALSDSFAGGGGGGGSGFVNLGLPSLSNVESNPQVHDSEGLVRITYTLPTPTSVLVIGDTTVTEGNSGTSNATFTVSLSEPSAQPVTVDYATEGGTATAGEDYVPTGPTGSTLTFGPGVRSRTISVQVNGDTQYEPDETFFVNLTNPTNATISDSRGIGTITNDDLPPDPTAPTVSTTSPGDNGTMGRADLVTATFSEEVKGVSEQTFFLKQYTIDKKGKETYVPVAAKVTTPNGITAVLDPTKDLGKGTYQVTITEGVSDKAGNALVPKTWSFKVVK
jgi:hypothetical protein